MALLLHLSDTHFGTEVPEVVAALLDLSHRLRPQVAVLSGDVTQRAHPRQFEAAAAFMRALAVPVQMVLPGNHDLPLFNLWARCCAPYAAFDRVFGPRPPRVIDTPEFMVLGVDTTRPWRHKAGTVSADQVDHVAARLRGARPAQLRVVVTHQPLAIVTPADRHNLLRGHESALAAWSQAGADLMLGGHIHLPYVVPLRQPGSGHEPLDRVGTPWVVQAGTAVSRRVRAGSPNSVHVLEWTWSEGQRCCHWQQYDHVAARRRFEPAGPPRTLDLPSPAPLDVPAHHLQRGPPRGSG